jgi:hypothetical protein
MAERIPPDRWINVLRGIYTALGETHQASLFVLETVHTALDRAGTARQNIEQASQYSILRGWGEQWHRAMQRLQLYYAQNAADHETVMEAVLWGRYPPDLAEELREPTFRMHVAEDDTYLEGQADATIAAILFNQMVVATEESGALHAYDPGGAGEVFSDAARQFENAAPGEAETFRDAIEKVVEEAKNMGDTGLQIATAVLVGAIIIGTVIYARG